MYLEKKSICTLGYLKLWCHCRFQGGSSPLDCFNGESLPPAGNHRHVLRCPLDQNLSHGSFKTKKKKHTLTLLTFSAARCPHEVFHSVKVKRKFLDVGLKGIKLKGSKMSDWFRVFNPCGINLKKASGAITRSKFHVSFTSPVSLLTAHGHLSKVQSSGPSVSMNNILNSCQLCHKRTTWLSPAHY